MLFTGQADITIDPKQRLAIPAKFRSLVVPERDGTVWYCVPFGNSLRLFTEKRFEELASRMDESLVASEEETSFEADFFALAERLDPDSAGRIVIPKSHLQAAGLGTEVVVIGAKNRLEVRDRTTWNSTMPRRLEELPNLAARVGGMRKGDSAGKPPATGGT